MSDFSFDGNQISQDYRETFSALGSQVFWDPFSTEGDTMWSEEQSLTAITQKDETKLSREKERKSHNLRDGYNEHSSSLAVFI